jgi:hypothetical protein
VQYRSLPAPVQPRRPSGSPWYQPLAALGLAGSLAAAALVSADLFFIASERLLPGHLVMIGYWVAVGVLSTTALCVRYHHRWLLELTARLPLFVSCWAGRCCRRSGRRILHSRRAVRPRFYLEVVLGIFICFAFTRSEVITILTWTFAGILLLNLACPLLVPEEGLQYVTPIRPPVLEGRHRQPQPARRRGRGARPALVLTLIVQAFIAYAATGSAFALFCLFLFCNVRGRQPHRIQAVLPVLAGVDDLHRAGGGLRARR